MKLELNWVLWAFFAGLCLDVSAQQISLFEREKSKAEKYFQLDSNRLALIHYNKAYRLVYRTDNIKAANLCVAISGVYYSSIGDFKMAIQVCKKGLLHLRAAASPSDSTSFKLYSILGQMFKLQFNVDSSYFYFQQAEQVLERNALLEQRIPDYVLHHYNNQGQLLLTFQDYSRSMVYFQHAATLAVKYKMDDGLPFIYSSIAECYDLLEKHPEALLYRKKTLQFHPQLDIQRAAYLSGLAWTLYQMADYRASMATSQNILKLLATIQITNPAFYRTLLIKQHWFIGACYYQQRKYGAAEQKIAQGIALYQAYFETKNENLANLYQLRAQIALQKKDYDQALNYLHEVQKIVLLTTNPDSLTLPAIKNPTLAKLSSQYSALAWQRKYQKKRQTADLAEAIKAYELAMSLRQITGKSVEDKQVQLLISEQNFSLYPEAIRMAFEAHQLHPKQFSMDRVFRWFEAFQANLLNDAVKVSAAKKRTLPPHILEEERQLERQLLAFRNKPSIDTAVYNSLYVKWYRFKQKIQTRYPAYYRSIYTQAPFRLADLQRTLDHKTVYLGYIWQNDCLYTMAIGRTHAEIMCRRSTDKFESSLKELKRQLFLNPGLGPYTGAEWAVNCYQYLLEPLRKQLAGKEHVVISRDPRFQFLPFELLETGRKQKEYMLAKFGISYTYSASWYWQHPARDTQQKKWNWKDLFAGAVSTLMIAPFIDTSSATKQWDPVSSLKETRSIGGEAWMNSKATKTALSNEEEPHRIIHFATHTFMDSADAFKSYLQLYPDRDSRLYFDDICHLSLQNTALVVLGTCEGAQGNTVQGEGVMSLARAFAYAGVRSVITTTWEANNDALSIFSMGVHRYIQQGYPIDKALQKVRMEMAFSKEFSKFRHPYFWANYTLMGNYEAIYFDKYAFFEQWLPYFTVAVLMLFGGIVWLAGKKITLWISKRTKPIR